MSEQVFNNSQNREIGRKLLVSIAGVVFCAVSVYAGYLYGTRFDARIFSLSRVDGAREFLLCYFDELKYFIAVFFAGFTVFAPMASAEVLLWRSAEFGCALYLFLTLSRGELLVYDSAAFVSVVVSGSALILLLVISLASVMHSRSLRYAVPDARTLLTYPETRGFIRAFIAVAAVVLLLLLVKTFSVSLLP